MRLEGPMEVRNTARFIAMEWFRARTAECLKTFIDNRGCVTVDYDENGLREISEALGEYLYPGHRIECEVLPVSEAEKAARVIRMRVYQPRMVTVRLDVLADE